MPKFAASTFDVSAISAYSLVLNWPFVKCHNYSASNDLPIERNQSSTDEKISDNVTSPKPYFFQVQHSATHSSTIFGATVMLTNLSCDIKEQTAEILTCRQILAACMKNQFIWQQCLTNRTHLFYCNCSSKVISSVRAATATWLRLHATIPNLEGQGSVIRLVPKNFLHRNLKGSVRSVRFRTLMTVKHHNRNRPKFMVFFT